MCAKISVVCDCIVCCVCGFSYAVVFRVMETDSAPKAGPRQKESAAET